MFAGACVEGDLYAIRILLVAIHQKHRPLAIGAFHRISRNQRPPGIVEDVALGWEYVVYLITGSDPFEINQLRHKELRKWLLNVVLAVDRERTECSRRIVASMLHRWREIVGEIDAVPSG